MIQTQPLKKGKRAKEENLVTTIINKKPTSQRAVGFQQDLPCHKFFDIFNFYRAGAG